MPSWSFDFLRGSLLVIYKDKERRKGQWVSDEVVTEEGIVIGIERNTHTQTHNEYMNFSLLHSLSLRGERQISQWNRDERNLTSNQGVWEEEEGNRTNRRKDKRVVRVPLSDTMDSHTCSNNPPPFYYKVSKEVCVCVCVDMG